MEVKVDLSGEQINDALAKAILDSVIGDKLLNKVEIEVEKIVSGYQSTLDGIVNQEISNHIRELLRTEYKEKIQAAVRERFNSDETITKAVELVTAKMIPYEY